VTVAEGWRRLPGSAPEINDCKVIEHAFELARRAAGTVCTGGCQRLLRGETWEKLALRNWKGLLNAVASRGVK